MIFAVNLHVVSYMYGINLLAVLIFFVSKHNIRELDDFFLKFLVDKGRANLRQTIGDHLWGVPMTILAKI